MIQDTLSIVPQTDCAYKASASHKRSSTTALQDIKSLIKATDLRDLTPRILGTFPQRKLPNHDVYNAEIIGRPERTPSLMVYSNHFHDYGSHDKSGDHIDLARLVWGCEFKDAVQGLADLLGLSGDSRSVSTQRKPAIRSTPQAQKLPTPQWQAAMRQVIEQAQHQLWNTPLGLKALEYLRSEGYSDEMMQQRELGFNPKWHEVNVPSGESCWIAPGILYPWQQGETLYGIKIRCPFTGKDGQPDKLTVYLGMRPEKQKYIQVKGSVLSAGWYGEIMPNTPVIITEGEKDCDNLIRRVPGVSVITVGSASNRLPDSLLKALQAASPQYIVLALDNDAAGQVATDSLRKQLEPLKFPRLVAELSEGYKDITQFILDGGNLASWLLDIQIEVNNKELARLAATSPKTLTYFPRGLPDRFRSFILNLHRISDKTAGHYLVDHASLAIVLELRQEAIQHGLLKPDAVFSIKHLVELSQRLNRNCSDHTVRTGLNQGVALGFFKMLEASNSKEDNMPPDFQKTSSRGGRPSKQYIAVPLVEVLSQLKDYLVPRLIEAIYGSDIPADAAQWLTDPELIALMDQSSQRLYTENEQARNHAERDFKTLMRQELSHVSRFDLLCLDPSTPLVQDRPYESSAAYRACYRHSYTQIHNGKPLSRAEDCQQLGVADSSLSNVRKRAKVIAEPQFLEIRLSVGRGVQEQIEAMAPWATEWNGGRWLKFDGQKYMVTQSNLDKWAVVAETKLAQGIKVELVVQKASRLWIVTAEDLLKIPPSQAPKRSSKRPNSSTTVTAPETSHETPTEKNTPALTCQRGVTSQFIRDQLRLRLPEILGRRELRELLSRYNLLAPEDEC